MKKVSQVLLAMAAAAVLSACGGGGDDGVLVASADVSVPVNATATGAVVNTPFTYPSGVSELGTSAATTVTFTNTATTPAFSISSGGSTATGVTTFGSCIFTVSASTFPASHPLAAGKTVTVNPCNLNVAVKGVVANGVATTRSVALLLGAAASTGASVTVAVNAGGQLTLNGASVGTVTLVAATGGT
jgi:hypothetical protein